MKRNHIIILLILVLAISGIWYYRVTYMPKYNWWSTFRYNNDEPFDASFLYDVLEESTEEFQLIKERRHWELESEKIGQTYFLIGEFGRYDSLQVVDLFSFVDKGNNAFIAAPRIPSSLWKKITGADSFTVHYKDTCRNVLSLSRQGAPDLIFHHRVLKDSTADYCWKYLEKETLRQQFDSIGAEAIHMAEMEEGIWFFRVPHGKGFFYFCLNPVLLSNYYLRSDDGFELATAIFEQVGTQSLLWDEYSKKNHLTGLRRGGRENPFAYLLSQKSLRWAWFVTLGLVGFFLVFNTRRRQQPIPLMPPQVNSSVDYATAVATLFYKKNAQSHISGEMFRHFQTFVRNRYQMAVSFKSKEEEWEKLAKKSGLPLKQIEAIWNNYRKSRFSGEEESENLIALNDTLDIFYKNCK